MHKAFSKSLPSALTSYFINVDNVHHRSTRSSAKNNCFFYQNIQNKNSKINEISQGISIWNQIDPLIRTLNYKQFCSKFKAVLITKIQCKIKLLSFGWLVVLCVCLCDCVSVCVNMFVILVTEYKVYINNFFLIFDIFGGCSTRRP